ncbi:MAG: response regulator, partial [Lachnospiraceae bacterium]|nr:response regulator [Lachnospiraceae bacterium]
LDVEMPKENGIELAKKIKAMQPDIKIILTSGDERYESDALAAGVIGFRTKPITEDDFEKCLQEN